MSASYLPYTIINILLNVNVVFYKMFLSCSSIQPSQLDRNDISTVLQMSTAPSTWGDWWSNAISMCCTGVLNQVGCNCIYFRMEYTPTIAYLRLNVFPQGHSSLDATKHTTGGPLLKDRLTFKMDNERDSGSRIKPYGQRKGTTVHSKVILPKITNSHSAEWEDCIWNNYNEVSHTFYYSDNVLKYSIICIISKHILLIGNTFIWVSR